MPQMNPAQARAVDPILTAVARGYRSQKAAIANVLFPIVTVGARAGFILAFGKEHFRLVNTVRAPGTNTKRIQMGYGTERYSLVDHRLEALVPLEIQDEAQAVIPGIDVIGMHVNTVQDRMALERENQAAVLARDPAKYDAANKATVAAGDKWATATTVFDQVGDAKEAIRAKTGVRPNVLALGPKVLTGLRNNPAVLDRLSTASDRPPATIEQLQRLFEIERIVEGEAVAWQGSDAAGEFVDLWGTDAILAYTTPAPLQQQGSPSYGYTYQLGAGARVEQGYMDNNANSWAVPVADAYQAALVGASAGFLFQGAV